MTDKNMTLDIIDNIKSDISTLSKAICECSDLTLRQTLQQMCGSSEQTQYDLYNQASRLGFYTQPSMATKAETSSMKETLSRSVNEIKGMPVI